MVAQLDAVTLMVERTELDSDTRVVLLLLVARHGGTTELLVRKGKLRMWTGTRGWYCCRRVVMLLLVARHGGTTELLVRRMELRSWTETRGWYYCC
jgi:hypothetical protein